MAEIFLAQARSIAGLERHVVLKRIRPEHGNDPRWVDMFLDEARLAVQLQHPNIAQVFDLGRIDDTYFFTMEYVHGENMRDVFQRAVQLGRRLPLSLALAVAARSAAGLAHAHERRGPDGRPLGIVHRDVSPSNLMVSFDGSVKVVDFGVAKATSRTAESRDGTVKGKIAYLSPEQCKGRPIDHRSDIFSLGIVLYEMCTTTRLFRRASDFETMKAILEEPSPPRPSLRNPDIPPGLDEVILRALARNPLERFPSCTALEEALESIADRHGISLSASTVRRALRELIPYRPEPWRELANPTAPVEPVTIDDADVIYEPSLYPATTEGRQVPLLADLRNRTLQLRSVISPSHGTTVPVVAATGPVPRSSSPGLPGLPPPPGAVSAAVAAGFPPASPFPSTPMPSSSSGPVAIPATPRAPTPMTTLLGHGPALLPSRPMPAPDARWTAPREVPPYDPRHAAGSESSATGLPPAAARPPASDHAHVRIAAVVVIAALVGAVLTAVLMAGKEAGVTRPAAPAPAPSPPP